MENIISIFMVFFLIVACSLITVFFAVQVGTFLKNNHVHVSQVM